MCTGYMIDDIKKGRELFNEWTKSGDLKCITTSLAFEKSEGHLFWKKWNSVEKSVVYCTYDTNKIHNYSLPFYECRTKKCRNLKITNQNEFKEQDYINYSNGYDDERELLFVNLTRKNDIDERCNIVF
jgi:hypothetical protein